MMSTKIWRPLTDWLLTVGTGPRTRMGGFYRSSMIELDGDRVRRHPAPRGCILRSPDWRSARFVRREFLTVISSSDGSHVDRLDGALLAGDGVH